MITKHFTCARVLLLGAVFASAANAQVFTKADGAQEGPAQFGQGQALYGSFGLDSANDPEYNIYRKYLRRETDELLSSATNVDGNLGEAEWTDVNQRQAGSLAGQPKHTLTAPGMFIGTKNHKNDAGWVVSNPDQLLYFKPLIDESEAEDAVTGDSNRNVFWDTRFGFMENPQDYIDNVEPNSNQLDLWTGDFNTDAVYLQNHINRDDSTSEEVQQRTGHGGSFKLHAAASQFDDERGRQNYEITRTQIGTGEEQERAGFINAGTAYGDPVEVAWGMRLNAPDDPDEIFAREIEFFVKVGNVVSGGVFDPGADGEFTEAPPNQDGEDFEDFYFDWQNAVPVFFAGAQGLAQGTGGMGIFIPGDFGADGSVNLDDFNRLAGNYGAMATTYSSGDFTQDGTTDEADLTAWAGLASDAVKSEAVGAVSGDVGGSAYDFDGSGATDDADVMFVSNLFGVDGGSGGCVVGALVGDFDDDGTVAFADFLVLSANFTQEVGTYAEGDSNCDGTVDFSDFLALSANFGATAASPAAVPEPSSSVLILLGAMLTLGGRVRRR